MSRVFSIALKDIKLILRDKMSLFFIVGFPILMGLFFGLVVICCACVVVTRLLPGPVAVVVVASVVEALAAPKAAAWVALVVPMVENVTARDDVHYGANSTTSTSGTFASRRHT